ncbi:MAG: hypothetical protein PHE67_03280 [Campylobacterales bacterium]|nr:hypothetical protein [Campylobacterales bacterium]
MPDNTFSLDGVENGTQIAKYLTLRFEFGLCDHGGSGTVGECEISYKTTQSFLQIYKNDSKFLRIALSEYNGIKKVSLDSETIEVTYGDSKKRVYSLIDGTLLYEAGTNLCKISKTEKKLRKQQYLSRLANDMRAS